MRLYDSMRRAARPFAPLREGRVSVYGCGPTVYDYAHVGNFRTFVAYDLLHRHLRWRGFDVDFVVNLTDVDDKTIAGARKAGRSLAEHTDVFVEAFLDDARTLGLLPFTSHPRATEHVPAMVDFVQDLVDRGHAYRAPGGSVYYEVASFPRYGALSGKGADADAGRSRVDARDDEKSDPRDFALWKAAEPVDREVGAVWESPWGPGRPGWHLECSAMARSLLGDAVDIHVGGEDLLFPHHENEIAQSEAVTGRCLARFWLHTKHLRFDDRKMSKSSGDFRTVRELVDEGRDPAAIRWVLLSAHYRSELNFTWAGLDDATARVQRLVDFHRRVSECGASPPRPGDAGLAERARERLREFGRAMDEDLNAPRALAALWVLVREGNAALDEASGSLGRDARDAILAALDEMDAVLGILALARDARDASPALRARIRERVARRERARGERRFAEADRIRDELLAMGVQLEDTPSGTRWKRVRPGPDAPGSR